MSELKVVACGQACPSLPPADMCARCEAIPHTTYIPQRQGGLPGTNVLRCTLPAVTRVRPLPLQLAGWLVSQQVS